jgi:hypothetical protein
MTRGSDGTSATGGECPEEVGADGLPWHDARALTGGGMVARVRLDQAVYTLRITRQGKLILTK